MDIGVKKNSMLKSPFRTVFVECELTIYKLKIAP